MTPNDPHLVYSELSSCMVLDEMCVDVQIYRLDFYPVWALEVTTADGTSLVWSELFHTDTDAFATFQMAAKEGMPFLLSHVDRQTLH